MCERGREGRIERMRRMISGGALVELAKSIGASRMRRLVSGEALKERMEETGARWGVDKDKD